VPTLKTSPGPINPIYPFINVTRAGSPLGEIWTDIEFKSLSYTLNPGSPMPSQGDFHELDIIMTKPGVRGMPRPEEILLGVECKHTAYQKSFLREILGIRRELSLLKEHYKTAFDVWPRAEVPAKPPSCLLAYSSSPLISNYQSPGKTFGIDFFHEPV
jgi:hypothetical protein